MQVSTYFALVGCQIRWTINCRVYNMPYRMICFVNRLGLNRAMLETDSTNVNVFPHVLLHTACNFISVRKLSHVIIRTFAGSLVILEIGTCESSSKQIDLQARSVCVKRKIPKNCIFKFTREVHPNHLPLWCHRYCFLKNLR